VASSTDDLRNRIFPGVSWFTIGFAAVFAVSVVMGVLGIDAPFSWLSAMLMLFSAGVDLSGAQRVFRAQDRDGSDMGLLDLISHARKQSVPEARAVVSTARFLAGTIVALPVSFLVAL